MAKTSPAPEVVCDAGPLIHLDELDCLDLLTDFSPQQSTLHIRPDLLNAIIAQVQQEFGLG